jgi:hypothetical protein
MNPPIITTDEMEAAMQAHLAVDRAQCDQVPNDDVSAAVYGLGFAAGAQWCIDTLKAKVTAP